MSNDSSVCIFMTNLWTGGLKLIFLSRCLQGSKDSQSDSYCVSLSTNTPQKKSLKRGPKHGLRWNYNIINSISDESVQVFSVSPRLLLAIRSLTTANRLLSLSLCSRSVFSLSFWDWRWISSSWTVIEIQKKSSQLIVGFHAKGSNFMLTKLQYTYLWVFHGAD